jgi:outer membrane protein assembly factor BamB
MRAIQVKCPQCGAVLNVDDAATSLTCQYCGTASRVQPRSRILQVPRPLPPDVGEARPVARQPVNRTAAIVPLVITLGAAGFVTLLTLRSVNKLDIPGIPSAADRPDTWSSSSPVVVDADADGTDDLIGITRNVLDGDRAQLAVYSGRDGTLLWKTARLGTYSDVSQAFLFAAGAQVVMATSSGELRAFDLTTGAARWTIPLGERVSRVCSDGATDAVALGTADKRWHRVALVDGKRTDRADPPLLDRNAKDPKRLPVAWVAAEQTPDTCLPVPSTERDQLPGLATADSWSKLPAVDGMRVARLVRRGAGPVVAIGGKSPGTAVPMLAVLDGAQPRWKAVIPATDPLEARADDEHVTVNDVAAFVVYETKSGPRVTALSLADGRRLWDQPLRMKTHLVLTGVVITGANVVVSTWGSLQAFDAATGAPAFLVGEI